jgi:hypothetical protein
VGLPKKKPLITQGLKLAGGGRSLERTPISVPIPVNRVINRESSQYPPESNEATTPYLSKNAGCKRFCADIKENLSGNFLAETGKQNQSFSDRR